MNEKVLATLIKTSVPVHRVEHDVRVDIVAGDSRQYSCEHDQPIVVLHVLGEAGVTDCAVAFDLVSLRHVVGVAEVFEKKTVMTKRERMKKERRAR